MDRSLFQTTWSHAPARAVIHCVGGAALALGLSALVSAGTFVSISFALTSVFGLLLLDWVVHRHGETFDPAAVFASFLGVSLLGRCLLSVFFIDTMAGPFAHPQVLWTLPNMLANAAFGLFIAVLAGALVGLTYRTALGTLRESTLKRGLRAAALVLPGLFFLNLLERVFHSMSF
ncbi:hypothetical protein DL240_11205 [Lujinxingia litoralis]|uniref:Uncharacterized protein n=1 Tax=Lujinxingia litoralis TaxID=2211119 RepID=A0A328C776_9DELT|nr:hypothetical protein [Lujinxingia litoralis]RAL22408.1 hypothetical protein DL240_11205 [Lujinxingia litoralis]